MEDKEIKELIAGIYEHLIGMIKYQNWLNDSLIKIRLEENQIINIMKQDKRNWNYLTKELRKLIEEHDGLYSYVTSNLSKRIEKDTTKGRTNRYNKYIS